MKSTDEFAAQSSEQSLKELQTDAKNGLSSQEAARRLARYGYNEISEKEEPLWHRIFRRFWGPIPWMIEIAAILSAMVQKWEDFVIITIMLLINGLLDFFQEHRALNALKALKGKLAQKVTVLRDGSFITIESRELVPGDIIKLRIGDVIPADVQLLEGDYLSIDQSSLTGESLPVVKKAGEIAYANTIIKQGEMTGVVVNTAANTRFHSVVALVARATLEERSHFQKMVLQIGNFLIILTVALAILILMVALFRHENFIEIARFALVLTVAAIPVALPAVLSVTMAVGALNLARKQAIVSRLTAIEELAGVDVFCSDKTGTLTKNEMQVAQPVLLGNHEQRELFLYALLASRREDHDPIELPLFHYAEQHFPDLNLEEYQQVDFVPFDPVHKRTEATISGRDGTFRVFKGAAQVLLEMADLPDSEAIAIANSIELLASKGYRTLAVARQDDTDSPLEIVGLVPLIDPPRDDSPQVINDMKAYGVRVKMVTGDNMAIAREIGSMLGLTGRTMRAEQLSGKSNTELIALVQALTTAIYHKLKPEISTREARKFADSVMEELKSLYDVSLLNREFLHTHESAIIEMIEETDIFAEVVPEDKYMLVDRLQKGGHIVGMTGDGVNDAPALKKANCGFAVSNATDAARAAADIILTAPGLTVINHAIEQARITFERMKSYSIFRIAETIRIILFMTLSIVVFNFYPITALMIIILALLNDIPILAIAYDRTKVQKQPVKWNMSELLTVASTLGVSGVLSSFLLFFILVELKFSNEMIQSLMFAKLVIAGHGTIYNTRIDDWFWKKPYPSWLLFWATFSTRILGTIIAVYGLFIPAIGWKYAMYLWGYALAWFVFNDGIKMLTYRILRSRGLYE
ncbi:metal-transporting ATPase [Desulfolithobacter dissulfuricans]|uniref:Metal-transporting ATPase n=1 Tax=Desulfolithobacter dissulfuricans TaxID=2795293 RepID=A0A915U629_9BACT|nr:plasma-membrane proton-efflux P-type ATPase [Desulfolithobacter dissulfuricans]BCO09772.1 metal-transporting ATPase [Desulfolithobacter dissulfuricans]